MLNSESEYLRMAAAEEALWWYRALHDQVLTRLHQQSLPQHAAIIDAACGTGGLLLALKRAGYTNAQGFDLSPLAVRIAKERGLSVTERDLRAFAGAVPAEAADAVICNDAIYFLKEAEQHAFLLACAAALKPGGLLIMNIPALAIFRGTHDEAVGIRHRMNKREVHAMFMLTPYAIETLRYWPFILSPAIAAARTLQRLRPRKQISDIDLPSPLVNNLLYRITRAELGMPARAPCGSSLFTVAKKTG